MTTNFLVTRILSTLTLAALALVAVGCGDSEQIAANQQLVQQQQVQLEQQQQEIEALKSAGAGGGYTAGAASTAGGCDRGVEATATQRGGERFAANDFSKALGYYQDALAACPNDQTAELNVAHAYEALGNKPAAIKHYRIVADANTQTVTDAQDQAKAALLRLQATQMP